ncbi:MAG TPA: septum formation initiator family protein [Myxococcales bacterium]|nr:septum formation initiator family protein [Myxococcales bacterium]
MERSAPMDFWARSNRPRVVVAGAAAASLVIAAAALADPHGVPLLRRLGQDIARQEAANQALREENSRLHRRVRALSVPMDPRVLEKEAREQLGFVRPDEVLVKFE